MPAKTLVVIGGGAAGFFCAVNAARLNPKLKVILLEKSNKLLSKVKVSGGGRCNVTHACFDIAEMSRQYPRGNNFVKKTFHQFFTVDTIDWFEQRGVKLKTEEDGRMFPVTDSSQTIIECLLKEASIHNVEIRMNAEVKRIRLKEQKFNIEISSGPQLPTPDSKLSTPDSRLLAPDYVCVACGGYPKLSMFDWLKELGHSIEEPVPSLFTFNLPAHPITKLMGVSVTEARMKIHGTKLEQTGPVLITHWGLSGPAVLKLSARGARELFSKNWEFGIIINWLPSAPEKELREKIRNLRIENGAQKIINRNGFGLPQRLWEFLVEQSGINKEQRWADLILAQQNKLINRLLAYEMKVKGKTTFKEEFVTAGGIKLSEVDSNTMMSRKIQNLFFAGEILDVDGITGGYNFQHAWTSGFVAAKAMAENKK